MKITVSLLTAGLAVAVWVGPVMGFGRGAAAHGARVGPGGGVRTGGAARGVSTGPYGGVHAGQVHGQTYHGPGGTTVQHAGASGASRGPLGGVSAGGGSATRVTGPGGQSYTHTQSAGARVGPAGGVRAGAGSSSSVRTPYGGAAVSSRAGAAVGPAGGARVGAARGGVAVGPYGAVGGGARYGAVGHRTAYSSPSVVRGTAVGVRSVGYSHFNSAWYRGHANAWVAPRWVAGYNLWRPPVWGSVATFVGVTAPPAAYDYGSTVVIENDNVYYDGEPVATAVEYCDQASRLVDVGRTAKPAETDEWQPLGVFGMIQQDEKTAQRFFQLAINKAGVVRGNYYDAVADNTLPVVGSLGHKTQRVAWSIGDKKDIVFETGLATFTKEEGSVLVHYGKEKTDQMILVRLEEPTDAK